MSDYKTAATPKTIRQKNSALIYDILSAHSELTLDELSEKSGLSRTAVRHILNVFAEQDIIKTGGKRAAEKSGNRPALYRLNPDHGAFVYLLLSSVFLLAESCDFSFMRSTYRYRQIENPEYHKVISQAAAMVKDLCVHASIPQLKGIVIAVSGNINPINGRLMRLTGTDAGASWGCDRDIVNDIRRSLDFHGTVFFDGILSFSGSAVCKHYSMDKSDTTLYILAHKYGIGSVLFRNGSIVKGANGIAGEIGHMRVDLSEDTLCRCGRRGCLEALLSPSMIKRRLRYPENADHAGIEEVLKKAEEGDASSCGEVKRIARFFATVLFNQQLAVDPHHMIFHNAYDHGGAYLFQMITQELRRMAPGSPYVPINLIHDQHGLPEMIREGAFNKIRDCYIDAVINDEGAMS